MGKVVYVTVRLAYRKRGGRRTKGVVPAACFWCGGRKLRSGADGKWFCWDCRSWQRDGGLVACSETELAAVMARRLTGG